MAGFFDSLADSLEDRLGDRPGETGEEMLHRKLPATSYADDLIGNIPQGIMNLGQGTYEAVTHPGQTAESLAGYAMNPRQTASDIYQHYADRYRNLPTALETLRTDPVGVAGDVLPFTALRGLARGATGAARRMRPSGVSGEVISPSAAREVGSTPEGWDFNGPRAAGPTVEAPSGDWESITGLRRTDRTRPWKAPLFAEPRLNAADMPYRFGLEENMYRTEPPAISGPSSQAAGATNYTSRTPLPRYTNYEAPVSTELKPQIADLLRSIREEGRAPNRFEQNMLNMYYGGKQGQAASRAMAEMPVTVIPRGVQRIISRMDQGIEPTRLELMTLRKHFAGRTGLKSRAALDRIGMDREILGPYPEFRAQMSERIAPPEEAPAGGGGRESLVRRALDVASRVAPRVGEGMMVGAPAGIATGLAYNAMRDSGAGSTPPVVPVTEREERPATAAPFMSVVDPKYFAATDFEPSAGSDRRELVNAPMPPRRPAINVERKGAPSRSAEPGRGATPTRRPAPKRAAPQRERDTGKRYYGDYRDTEPFASDPIGQFIDELTGQRKMARKPGRQAPSSGGLGDLLPFADGGTVRRPFADGGADNRIPILSDIGDAIGGMMQGGGQPAMAADRGSVDKENIFERWANNPLSQYLFAAGLGMMASPQANPLMAIGEGGLRGLEYMQAVQANADMRRKEREAAERRRQELEIIKNLDKDDSVYPETAPSKVATVESEPVQPSVAPVKTAAVEPVKPVTTEPVSAPIAAPVTSTAAIPQKAASTPEPIVATDDRLQELNRINNKIIRALPFMEESGRKDGLKARQRAVQSEIERIYRQRENAIKDANVQRGLDLQEKRLKIEEEYKDPVKTFERAAQQEAGKTQNERIKDIDDAAVVASQTMDQIKDVISGYKTGDVYTSPKVFEIFKTLQGLGYQFAGAPLTDWAVSPKGIENTETLAKLGVADLLKKLKGSLGNGVSEGDRRIVETQALGIDKSPASNIKALRNLEKLMQRALDIQEFKKKYVDKYGGLDKDFEVSLSQHFGNKPLGLEKPSIPEKSEGSKRPEGVSDEDIRREIQRKRGAGG